MICLANGFLAHIYLDIAFAYLCCVKDGLNYDLCLSLDLNPKEGLAMRTSASDDAFISHLKD